MQKWSGTEGVYSLQKTKKCLLIRFTPEFPGLLIVAATVDKVGRKLSMASLFFLCCLFLLPLAFSQSGDFVIPLLFGARICISATFTIVYIYAPEVTCETVCPFDELPFNPE